MLPVLDCSVVGAGKTFIALDVLNRVQRQFLIICPKIVITHWKEAVQQAQIEHLSLGVVNYEKIKFGNTEYFNDKYEWNLPQNSIVIFDEAHKLKGYQTFNSKLLLNLPTHIATPYLISATIADSPIAFVNVAKAFKICTNEYKFLYSFGYSRNALKAWEFDKNPEHLQRLHNIIFNIQNHPGVRITYDKISILTKTNTVKLMPIKDTYEKISHLYELIEEDSSHEQHHTNKLLSQPRDDDEHFFELMQKTQLAPDLLPLKNSWANSWASTPTNDSCQLWNFSPSGISANFP
jgi:Rad3-related DNA helicase